MLVTRRRTVRPRAPLLQLDIDFRFSLYRIGGRRRDRGVSFGGATLGIPPLLKWKPNPEPVKPGRGQCLVGSLTGAVASQRVTEAPKGSLSMFGNHAQSVKVEGSLTARPTSRAGTKVGLSDPAVREWNCRRSTDKSYLGDNRLISPKSPHRRGGLAPRCRLVTSWG